MATETASARLERLELMLEQRASKDLVTIAADLHRAHPLVAAVTDEERETASIDFGGMALVYWDPVAGQFACIDNRLPEDAPDHAETVETLPVVLLALSQSAVEATMIGLAVLLGANPKPLAVIPVAA